MKRRDFLKALGILAVIAPIAKLSVERNEDTVEDEELHPYKITGGITYALNPHTGKYFDVDPLRINQNKDFSKSESGWLL